MQIHAKYLGVDKTLALHSTDVMRCGWGLDVHLDRKQKSYLTETHVQTLLSYDVYSVKFYESQSH